MLKICFVYLTNCWYNRRSHLRSSIDRVCRNSTYVTLKLIIVRQLFMFRLILFYEIRLLIYPIHLFRRRLQSRCTYSRQLMELLTMANFTKSHCEMMKQQYVKFKKNQCIKHFDQRQLHGVIISTSSKETFQRAFLSYGSA